MIRTGGLTTRDLGVEILEDLRWLGVLEVIAGNPGRGAVGRLTTGTSTLHDSNVFMPITNSERFSN